MMTTKEQERKALEQIRKIVKGLGEESYVGTAFEGCFEIAEENIENDFACSMKQRAESAELNVSVLAKTADESSRMLKEADQYAADVEEQFRRSKANYEKQIAALKESLDKANENAGRLAEMRDEADQAVEDMKKKLADRDAEILKLKAKLYDLICKD